jgi:acyl-coenzyme A synthetase/AMP-(fatty) acid ligase/acyl carrier protein
MQNQHNADIDNLAPNSLTGRLFHHAETIPAYDAIVTSSFTLSYAQLAERVRAQVITLKNMGISQKSVIGIRCEQDPQHLVLCLATTYIGATSCTIPSCEEEQGQKAVIDHCCVTDVLDESIAVDLSSPGGTADSILSESPAFEASLLFSTSGTTGEPKLVVHHDNDLVEQAHRHIGAKQERFTCRASMEHNFAKRHRLYCLAEGATNIFLSGELESVVDDCRTLQVNVMHLSSFQAQELLNQPDIQKLPPIRLKLGGSHIPLKLRVHLRATITPILQAGYGTTETGAIAFTDPEDPEAGESVGQALAGIEIRTVDEYRKPLKTGDRGELAIRCKGMFRGYLGRPELTSQRLESGWFYTGDIGIIDEKKRIHLSGRTDDMFTFNSMNIYPQEIESQIRKYPDVIDAVVLPKASSVHGNIPVALVVFNRNMKPDLSALRKFVQKRVGMRSPRHYTIVDEIPTNMSGKISRSKASELTERSDQIRQEMINLVDEKYTRHARPSQIKDFIEAKRDLSFRKLQMDSLARMDLLVSLETQYNIVITPQELARLRTLGKLASRVLTAPKEGATTPQNQQNSVSEITTPGSFDDADKVKPYIVRFFQRIYGYCKTVAKLNQVFANLESRLTPLDVDCLNHFHIKGKLIPHDAAIKFQSATSFWLNETQGLMEKSGKKSPEPFVLSHITPEMALFSSPKKAAEKTLLICFPPRGVRHLMIPNAVLLQHIDSTKFDLIMIAEASNGGYQFGTIPFGRKLNQQAQWLSEQQWLKQYKQVRTFGVSAGSFPAIALGYLLQAEITLSIAGRFHKKKHPLINLDKVVTTLQFLRRGNCERLLISYSANNRRDKKFASFISKVTKGKEIAIEIKTEKLPHLMLRRLAERGELASYFSRTLFAKADDALFMNHRKREMLSFPLSSK